MTLLEFGVVAGASLLGAFVKSVTGMGFPLIAVPLITLATGIEEAVVVVAAPNLIANGLLWLGARDGRGEARDLAVLVGFGTAGAVIGTFLLVSLPETPLLIALAVTIAIFVVTFVRNPHLRIPERAASRWSPVVGMFAGVMQGAVGVSGPVVATWLHGYRLPKQAYVYAVTAIFGTTGAIQFALLVGAGEVTSDRLVGSTVALVAVLAMVPVGTRLRARLAGSSFERAVLAVLVASGAALVLRVLG